MQQTIAIARGLARAHPGATVPCPVCAASLLAANLERHLGQVHQVGLEGVAAAAALLELVGVDRRIFWLTLLPGALWIPAVVTYVALHREPVQNDLLFGALIAWLLASLSLPLAVWFNRFGARLILAGSRLQLRYGLGLLSHELELPAALEAGSLWERRSRGGMHQYEHSPGEDVQVGSYLRLTSAGRSLTIGYTKGASLKKRWAPSSFHAGPKRRYWDITLDPVASVALEYHLAALNLLTPRSQV